MTNHNRGLSGEWLLEPDFHGRPATSSGAQMFLHLGGGGSETHPRLSARGVSPTKPGGGSAGGSSSSRGRTGSGSSQGRGGTKKAQRLRLKGAWRIAAVLLAIYFFGRTVYQLKFFVKAGVLRYWYYPLETHRPTPCGIGSLPSAALLADLGGAGTGGMEGDGSRSLVTGSITSIGVSAGTLGMPAGLGFTPSTSDGVDVAEVGLEAPSGRAARGGQGSWRRRLVAADKAKAEGAGPSLGTGGGTGESSGSAKVLPQRGAGSSESPSHPSVKPGAVADASEVAYDRTYRAGGVNIEPVGGEGEAQEEVDRLGPGERSASGRSAGVGVEAGGTVGVRAGTEVGVGAASIHVRSVDNQPHPLPSILKPSAMAAASTQPRTNTGAVLVPPTELLGTAKARGGKDTGEGSGPGPGGMVGPGGGGGGGGGGQQRGRLRGQGTRQGPGRRPRFGILTLCDANAGHICTASAANKRRYAALHGYDLIVSTTVADPSRPAAWSKILEVKRHLPAYDWLLFIDVDTLVMNPDVRLENIVDVDESVHQVIAADHNGVNSGVWMVRNSPWMMWFLDELWAQEHLVRGPYLFHYEQRAFHHLFQTVPWARQASVRGRAPYARAGEVREHSKVVNQCVFNSLLPWYVRGDFVVHFAGLKGVWECAVFWHYFTLSQERPGMRVTNEQWAQEDGADNGRGRRGRMATLWRCLKFKTLF